jgi:hypothetical protein
VLYREDDATQWAAALSPDRVRVHVRCWYRTVDEAEGYAFAPQPQDLEGAPLLLLPRLIRRYSEFPGQPVAGAAAQKLAEFDAGGDTRLILIRSAVAELVRVFLPAGSNESRLIDQIETQLNRANWDLCAASSPRLTADRRALRRNWCLSMRHILKAFCGCPVVFCRFDQRLAA